MAVNTAFTTTAPATYPISALVAGVGTTWQAFAPPTDVGEFEWLISGSAAIYFCEGAASDDGAAVTNYARHAVASETPFALSLTPEPGKRAHLLLAAQSGTASMRVQLKRVSR